MMDAMKDQLEILKEKFKDIGFWTSLLSRYPDVILCLYLLVGVVIYESFDLRRSFLRTYRTGEQYLKSGHYDKATELFTSCRAYKYSIFKTEVPLLINYDGIDTALIRVEYYKAINHGKNAQKYGRWEQAKHYFSIAQRKAQTKEEKDNAEKLRALMLYHKLCYDGLYYFNDGQYEQAIRIYQKAKDLKPQESLAQTQLSKIKSQLLSLARNAEFGNRWDDAIAHYTLIQTYGLTDISTQLKKVRFRKNIKAAQHSFEQQRWQEALKFYQQADSFIPNSKEVAAGITHLKDICLEKAKISQKKRLWEEALSYYRLLQRFKLYEVSEQIRFCSYHKYLSLGDECIRKQQWDMAEINYKAALQHTDEPKEVNTKIKEIGYHKLVYEANAKKDTFPILAAATYHRALNIKIKGKEAISGLNALVKKWSFSARLSLKQKDWKAAHNYFGYIENYAYSSHERQLGKLQKSLSLAKLKFYKGTAKEALAVLKPVRRYYRLLPPRERSSFKKFITQLVTARSMAFIRGGKFPLGMGVFVSYSSFYIGKTEVSRAEFEVFRRWKKNLRSKRSIRNGNYPIEFVSWFDALDYCKFRGGSLPTEIQWEVAACWDGKKKSIYPWGDQFGKNYCHFNTDRTVPVTHFKKGESPHGCLNMVGNVAEWCLSWYKRRPGEQKNMYHGEIYKVIKGGDYSITPKYLYKLKCLSRAYRKPSYVAPGIGFRCVINVEDVE